MWSLFLYKFIPIIFAHGIKTFIFWSSQGLTYGYVNFKP